MGLKVHFLGSGSRGNCTLMETDRWRVLIDIGFGVRRTNELFQRTGIAYEKIDATLLTHTHSDHVKKSTLRRLEKSNVPLVCRQEHEARLSEYEGYQYLKQKQKVRFYGEERFELLEGLTVEPLALSHDSPGTHGFIFDIRQGSSEVRVAYISDCGSDSIQTLSQKVRDADILALEFNHDEAMEKSSGRHPYLINRVVGPSGHLSNHRAAGLLQQIRSRQLKTLVQLHLSRDCNRPQLAMEAAHAVAPDLPIQQAFQDTIGPLVQVS